MAIDVAVAEARQAVEAELDAIDEARRKRGAWQKRYPVVRPVQLRLLRRASGLSHPKIAKAIGRSQSTLSQYDSGGLRPHPRYLVFLLAVTEGFTCIPLRPAKAKARNAPVGPLKSRRAS